MSTNVKLKRSSVAGRIPTTEQLQLGEIAINTNDGKLYFKKDNGTESIVDIHPYSFDEVTSVGATSTSEITVPSINIGDFAGGAGANLSWNAVEGTLDLAYDGVTLQVGQEQHFYAKATEAIANGEVVVFAGAQGDHLLVSRADVSVSGFTEEWVIGVATEDLAANEFGYITSFGKVRGLDTSAFSEGDLLYLDVNNPGQLTNIEPTKPNHVILIAAVSRSHLEEGTIFVRPSYREAFGELHDVNITTPAEGNLVAYDSATSTWVNTSDPVLNSLCFTPDEDLTHGEGLLYYHDEYKTLTMYNDIADISLQIGLEEWVRVYNATGSTILNGTPCRPVGVQGESQKVAPAIATSEGGARVLGVATHDIPTGTYGIVTVRGLVSGLDTSGLQAGKPIFLNETGGFQNTAPTYPYYPTQIGGCLVSDATNGYIYVSPSYDTLPQLRVSGNSHLDGNLTVDGDLIVNGTQSTVAQNNLSISDSFIYLNSGDAIGQENTTFTGSGLDDAYLAGYYEGPTTITYYVRIDGVGTGTGGVDTFEWSTDNFATTEATGVDITGDFQELAFDIGIRFNATTGHTSGDVWSGTAAPLNVDTGWATNRNTGTTGVGYTHVGVFFDVSDEKFKFFDEYAPEPSGTIDTGDASFNLGTVVAGTFEGNLDWSDITTKPTTISGYGITDAVTDGDFTGTAGFMKTDGAGTYSVDTNTYLTAESDTLDSVTTRGATTTNDISVGSVTIESDILQTKYAVTTSSITADPLMSFNKSIWHSAKLIVIVTRGSDKQVVELLVTHDGGSNAYVVEYGTIDTNGILGEFTVEATATDIVLSVTSTDAALTSYKASATLIK